MKKGISAVLVLAVLNLWVPCAGAEISEDLDPMVTPDAQATFTGESSVSGTDFGQTSGVVSTADATASEKKIEEPKKEKSKKSSKKKSSDKKKEKKEKKKKSSSKGSKKHNKNSR